MRSRVVILVSCALAGPVHAQHRPAGALSVPAGLDLYMPGATGVSLTSGAVGLGRQLFFDPRLSRDGTIACASCHDPARAFTDGRAVSIGVQGRHGARNAPTLVNRAYGTNQFWDGRVALLVEQVLHPIENPVEMDLPRADAAARLAADSRYARAFTQAFENAPDTISLARALAAYVASILSGNAPFDSYSAGDTLALNANARLGRRLFDGKATCSTCHRGPNFTDEQFHNTGLAWRTGVPRDSGRFAVTREPRHVGAFKTPTLREIARTAPYMHDGTLATLEEVVEFYDRGGHPNPYLDREMRPLRLTLHEKAALLAFLGALSGTVREGW